jgi:hypothetical protein
MQQVQTTKGLIDRDLLTTNDIVEEGENYRSIATEWFFNGELVRRDVAVSILCGLEMAGATEGVGNG